MPSHFLLVMYNESYKMRGEFMKKFILLYKGPAASPEMMTKEQGEASDSVWRSWSKKVGKALVDVGAPMTGGKAVVDDGSTEQATDLNGYSIIEAENMDEVLKLVEGNPFLMDKTGEFSVEVFELLPSPGIKN